MKTLMNLYTLDGTEPVPCADLLEWARWFDTIEHRRVLADHIGEWTVSTVFLGLDHNYWDGPPLLFETMAFREGKAREQARCSTWIGAEWQHARMLELVARRPKLELIETPRLLSPRRGKLRSIGGR